MSAIEQQDSHRPPSDGGMAKEEFIRVGTTLYKIVKQPRLNGGYLKKRIAWNNETLRQDYGRNASHGTTPSNSANQDYGKGIITSAAFPEYDGKGKNLSAPYPNTSATDPSGRQVDYHRTGPPGMTAI